MLALVHRLDEKHSTHRNKNQRLFILEDHLQLALIDPKYSTRNRLFWEDRPKLRKSIWTRLNKNQNIFTRIADLPTSQASDTACLVCLQDCSDQSSDPLVGISYSKHFDSQWVAHARCAQLVAMGVDTDNHKKHRYHLRTQGSSHNSMVSSRPGPQSQHDTTPVTGTSEKQSVECGPVSSQTAGSVPTTTTECARDIPSALDQSQYTGSWQHRAWAPPTQMGPCYSYMPTPATVPSYNTVPMIFDQNGYPVSQLAPFTHNGYDHYEQSHVGAPILTSIPPGPGTWVFVPAIPQPIYPVECHHAVTPTYMTDDGRRAVARGDELIRY